MRLAVIETRSHGGMLHYAVQLADALASRGNDVDLIVPRANELTGYQGAARRREVLMPSMRALRVHHRSPFARQLHRAGVAARLVASSAHATIETMRGRYDAVILQWDLGHRIGTAFTWLLTGLPARPGLAFVAHNVRPFNRWQGADLYLSSPSTTRRLRRAYARFDVVFVHGPHAEKELDALRPGGSTVVVPHGDEHLFTSAPPAPATEERALFFGDWRKVKGLSVLMDAFDRVADARPGARLTIAGTPAPADFDDEAVRRWAASHGDRVEVIGRYVPIADVPLIFARARVVVTPYLTGYQSGVVHLAMTMARAVVSSDVGDLPTVVEHGQTGLVVPAGDAVALADALRRVLANPELAEAMGARARLRIDELSNWAAVAERVEASIAEVLPRSPRRRSRGTARPSGRR